MVVWEEGHEPVQVHPEVFFWNMWRRRTRGEVADMG